MTSPGATFLGYDDASHLWIVLSQPDENGLLALANFTSHWSGQPLHETCPLVFQLGDHPWIQHETCIYWRGVELERRTLITDAIESGHLIAREPLSPDLLAQIQQTALTILAETHGAHAAIRATVVTD